MITQNNVDTDEIKKFANNASRWWDKQGDFKTLHDINPLRLEFIKQHCSLIDKEVLDIGCGGGILSEALAQSGAHVTAIDMATEALDIAKLHLNENNLTINYQLSTAEAFATKHQHSYDVITCMELLEHVPEPRSIITACKTMLKPGGHLFLSTLNRNPKSFLFAIIGAEYILRMLPTGTHDYAKFIRPAELAQWCRTENMQIQNSAGLQYNLLSRNYYLNDDLKVNYMVHVVNV